MATAIVKRFFRGLAVRSAPLIGMLYVVALAALAGRQSAGDDADLGDDRRAGAVASFVERRFGSEVLQIKIGVVATAVALGVCVGLVADILVRLRFARSRRPSALRKAFHVLAACAFVHGALVLRSMARHPQLYASHWYRAGGVPRTVQVIVTDVFGPTGVIVAALGVALLYVRPAEVVHRVKRVVGIFGRPLSSLVRRAHVVILVALAGAAMFGERTSHDVRAAVSSPPPTRVGKPNVLILAADSLRADHLDPRVAPNLDRLASMSTRFDRAYVSIPRTFPSWVTILTGRHVRHHGIRSMFPTWEERAKDFDALPRRFARAGYATGVVSDYAGDIFGRIDLGFERVDTPSFDFRQLIRQRALERETPLMPLLHSQFGRRLFPVMRELSNGSDPSFLTDDVDRALSAMKDKPFFLTVFFSTAHFPYAAPAPYYDKYADRSYRGRYKYSKPASLGTDAPLDADDVRQVRALYDGAVASIDDAMAGVLRRLGALGLANDTIVVVTADHGETLFDNGHGQGHGDHLFGDEGTHVPLLVYDPRTPNAGRREEGIVRDVDLAPTLYELAGIAPPPDLDGRSLLPALRGASIDPRYAHAETELWFTEDIPGLRAQDRIPYPGVVGLTELDTRHNAEIVLRKDVMPITTMARHRMVRDARYKLVYVPTRQGVRYMLFDTKSDPGETVDVAGAHPDDVARLKSELSSWILADPLLEEKDGFFVPRDGAFRSAQTEARTP